MGGSDFNGLLTISGAHPGGYGMLRLVSTNSCIIDMASTGYDNRLRHKVDGTDTWFVGMVDSTTYKWTDSGNSARLSLTTGGALTAVGSMTATGFFESSDMRLKKLIKDDYKALGIESIKARLYIKDGKEEIGYYAQDFEKILPSAVSTNDEGFFNLSYTQVHTAKIAIIEDEVDVLKKEVAELKVKLQKYEA